MCNGKRQNAECEDKSDQKHCDSDFFDILTLEDRTKGRVDYSEYLNIELIFKDAAVGIDEDILKRVVKHR